MSQQKINAGVADTNNRQKNFVFKFDDKNKDLYLISALLAIKVK